MFPSEKCKSFCVFVCRRWDTVFCNDLSRTWPSEKSLCLWSFINELRGSQATKQRSVRIIIYMLTGESGHRGANIDDRVTSDHTLNSNHMPSRILMHMLMWQCGGKVLWRPSRGCVLWFRRSGSMCMFVCGQLTERFSGGPHRDYVNKWCNYLMTANTLVTLRLIQPSRVHASLVARLSARSQQLNHRNYDDLSATRFQFSPPFLPGVIAHTHTHTENANAPKHVSLGMCRRKK